MAYVIIALVKNMGILKTTPLLVALACLPLIYASPVASAEQPQAAEDCGDGYYYGIGRTKDYAKAFQCYKREQYYFPLIIMQLNGEGTPSDPRKAMELFAEMRKREPHLADHSEGLALESAINDRLKNPREEHPRLDYCEDIADTTVTRGYCEGIADSLEEQEIKNATSLLGKGFPPRSAEALDEVSAAFTAFRDADADRIYQKYIEGTIRGTAALGQKSYLRGRFLKLLKDLLKDRRLEQQSLESHEKADAELNQIYQQDIRNDSQEYRKDARNAQRQWIRYRDAWAALAQTLFPERIAEEVARNAKTRLTRERIEELHYHPVGPGPEDE